MTPWRTAPTIPACSHGGWLTSCGRGEPAHEPPHPHSGAEPAPGTTRVRRHPSLLLTAAEAGPAKAAELDGELLSLCDEAVALHAENVAATDAIDAAGLPYSSPQNVAVWTAVYARSATWHELCAEIAALPARTPEGLGGKAIVLRRVVALEEPLVASLCRDLLGRRGHDRPSRLPRLHGRRRGGAAPSAHPDAVLLANVAEAMRLDREAFAMTIDLNHDDPARDTT